MACLDELTVLALVEGALGSDEADAAEAHIDACADCRELLAVVARTDEHTEIDRGRGSFEPGEIVGRYLVLHRVGAGGMGEVYAAWDTELDRKVALKVVTDDRARNAAAQRELVREAKSLASINHANVITVYDVGEIDGRLFLAMEFMDGGTLGSFLSRSPRAAWRAVLDHFLAAGEGLAAAHRVGLVHRDFKPDNVLLGDGDRVCVTDFGLARARARTQPTLDTIDEGVTTRAAGTPPYMAPEQLRGDEITARADQFGFCVAVWEGLFGERPFTGASPRALLAAIEAGVPRAGTTADVPTAIRRVLERGLAFDATQRYATLDDVLTSLRRAARVRRVALWTCAAVVVGLLGLGAAAYFFEEEPRCSDPHAPWSDVWAESVRADLRGGFEATGATYAGQTFERFEESMDRHVDAWAAAHRDTCAAEIRVGDTIGTSPRAICLEGQRSQAVHLLETLSQPTRSEMQAALSELLRLPRPRECDDAVAQGHVSDREEAEAVVAQLANAGRLDRMGRFDEAAVLVDDADRRAEAQGDVGLQASVTFSRGKRATMLGDAERGRDLVEEAGLMALRADRPDVAARAFSMLMYEDGKLRGPEFRLAWERLAEAMLARLGPVTPAHGAFALNQAYVADSTRNLDAARSACERLTELDAETIGADHPDALNHRAALANVLSKLGDTERAIPMLEEVLALQVELLGEFNRDVAITLGSLADALTFEGRGHEAMPYNERGLVMVREIFGAEHEAYALNATNYAYGLARLGETDRALALLSASRVIFSKSGDPDGTHRATVDAFTGFAHAAARDRERARAIWEATLADYEGPSDNVRYVVHLDLGRALRELGRLDEARVHVDAAMKLALGDPGKSASVTVEQAMLSLDAGRPDLETFERALASARSEPQGSYAVLTPFYLAQGLVRTGGDRPRAFALALEAHARALTYSPFLAAPVLEWIQSEAS